MLAWADQEALEATRETGLAHFHSRSRDRALEEGRDVRQHDGGASRITSDCDGDTLLMRVRPAGPACHTGEQTCFGPRRFDRTAGGAGRAGAVIESRRGEAGDSYVAGMLAGGARGAAAQGRRGGGRGAAGRAGQPELVAEVADLWFHSMLLLARDGIDPLAPLEVLRQRRKLEAI